MSGNFRAWIRSVADAPHPAHMPLPAALVYGTCSAVATAAGLGLAIWLIFVTDVAAPTLGPAQAPSSPGAGAPLTAHLLPPEIAPPSTAVPPAETVIAGLPPAETPHAPERRPITALPGTSGANPCSGTLASAIPQRRSGMPEGTAFVSRLMGVRGRVRDQAVVHAVLQGNVPGYLRELRPVRLTGMTPAGRAEVIICVTPDYLAVGSDQDNVRVPLGLAGALQVADAFDMILPTKRAVDAIYRQATVRVAPQPMPAGPEMSSTAYFLRHNRTVDAQLAHAGAFKGQLVAGIKKDVVLTNRLGQSPDRVAIYGWHRITGEAIQPLSTVHGASYADYSHGIRLVSRTAYLNGRAVDVRALLTDARYAGLLNDDGILTSQTTRVALLR